MNQLTDNGLILVDKPAGLSSFGVVAKVRWLLRQKYQRKIKVGHTGALDPFATGLMLLVVGKFTKQASQFSKLDKVYQTKIVLGKTTRTLDPESTISFGANYQPSLVQVKAVLANFVGTQSQIPPMFSALKINGQRAYKLARSGQKVELQPRQIEVKNLEIIKYSYPILEIKVAVSSGTYIRTLAADIGHDLGVSAYCLALRRLQVGEHKVENSLKIDENLA